MKNKPLKVFTVWLYETDVDPGGYTVEYTMAAATRADAIALAIAAAEKRYPGVTDWDWYKVDEISADDEP